MSELLWRRVNTREIETEASGVRLVVAPVEGGQGFRFSLLGILPNARGEIALASGFRNEMRDAMDAAERAARGYAETAPPSSAHAQLSPAKV